MSETGSLLEGTQNATDSLIANYKARELSRGPLRGKERATRFASLLKTTATVLNQQHLIILHGNILILIIRLFKTRPNLH